MRTRKKWACSCVTNIRKLRWHMWFCRLKKVWSSKLAAKDNWNFWRERIASWAFWRRVQGCLAQWHYPLQCSQQNSTWNRPQGIILHLYHFFSLVSVAFIAYTLLGNWRSWGSWCYWWGRSTLCISILWKCEELSGSFGGTGASYLWSFWFGGGGEICEVSELCIGAKGIRWMERWRQTGIMEK